MLPSDWDHLVEDLRAADTDRAVRAASIVSDLADRSHVPDLYRLLGDEDFFVREATAEPLARLEGARALPALLQALVRGEAEGHDNDGLTAVISDLLETHGREVGPLLVGMLGASTHEDRENAAWALGFLPADVAIDPLLVALRDASPAVRSAAASSLAAFDGDDVVVPLLECLKDYNELVRASAANALGHIGDRRAIPALHEALGDRDGRVRACAAHALELLQ